jgi:lipopolysaccharide biosynthesis regulator YciM
LEQIDDSGGYRYRTYSILQDLHGVALQRVEWTPEQMAAHLLDLVMDSDSDQFDDVPHAYAVALGDAGLNAFYADVAARLNSMPKLSAGAEFREKYPYLRLSNYLKDRAAEREDWGSLIELEKATATSERDYRQIAALCLGHADSGAAEEWLVKADAIDSGDNANAASLWTQVHIARENWREAVNAQRRVFQHEPEYENFSQLLELAERANCADQVRAETKVMLSEPVRNLWQAARHAFTLARIHWDEQDWEASYQAIADHVADPDLLLEAARWLREPAPKRGSELYTRAIKALIGKKNKRGYRDAVNALLEARPCFDAIDPDEFTRFVAALRTTHKQKRNLMATLDASL